MKEERGILMLLEMLLILILLKVEEVIV